MKSNRLLVAMLALVLTLSMTGLAACGGSPASSDTPSETTASSEQEKTPTGPSDEELIAADIEEVVGTSITKEELLEGLRADSDMLELEAQGLDLEAYAANMESKFKLEVVGVDVNGDKAVAHVALTSPEFGEAADALMEERVEAALADKDIESMTEEDFTKLMMQVVSEVLTDPAFPTFTETFDIDYVKNGDTWEMADESKVESALNAITDAAA